MGIERNFTPESKILDNQKPEKKEGTKEVGKNVESSKWNRRKFLKTTIMAAAGAAIGGKGAYELAKQAGIIREDKEDLSPEEKKRQTKEELHYRDKVGKEAEEPEEIETKRKVEEPEAKKPEKKEIDEEELKKPASKEDIKKISPQERMKAKEIANELLRVYNTAEVSRRFDKQVFTSDFYIAQQFQESRGKKEAVSKSGAKGVYQNRPDSVIDVIRYLDNMRSKGLIPYNGPSQIDDNIAEEVANQFLKKTDFGRACGKLYLLAIHDPDSTFNNKPNKNAFKGKSTKKIHRKLLAAYHDGPSSRYKTDSELISAAKARAKKYGHSYDYKDSAVYYYKTIFNFMDIEKNVRGIYKNENFKLKYEDTAVDRMLHIMEKYNFSQDKLKEQTNFFLNLLKEKKKKEGRDLSRGEIMDVFRPYLNY